MQERAIYVGCYPNSVQFQDHYCVVVGMHGYVLFTDPCRSGSVQGPSTAGVLQG